jgi:hypothetical protein
MSAKDSERGTGVVLRGFLCIVAKCLISRIALGGKVSSLMEGVYRSLKCFFKVSTLLKPTQA